MSYQINMDKLVAKYCAVCRAENVVPLVSVDYRADGWSCSLVGVAEVVITGAKSMDEALKKAIAEFFDKLTITAKTSSFNEEYRARYVARTMEGYIGTKEVDMKHTVVDAVFDEGMWRVVMRGPKDELDKLQHSDFPNAACQSEPIVLEYNEGKTRVIHPTDVLSATSGLGPLDPVFDGQIIR